MIVAPSVAFTLKRSSPTPQQTRVTLDEGGLQTKEQMD